jgi:hypothetical protein
MGKMTEINGFMKEHASIIICSLFFFILGTFVGPREHQAENKKTSDRENLAEEYLNNGYLLVDAYNVIHWDDHCKHVGKFLITQSVDQIYNSYNLNFCSCIPVDWREQIEYMIKAPQ